MIEGVTQRTSFDAWGGCVLVLVLLIFFCFGECYPLSLHCVVSASLERDLANQNSELRVLRNARIMQNAHLSYLCDDV